MNDFFKLLMPILHSQIREYLGKQYLIKYLFNQILSYESLFLSLIVKRSRIS